MLPVSLTDIYVSFGISATWWAPWFDVAMIKGTFLKWARWFNCIIIIIIICSFELQRHWAYIIEAYFQTSTSLIIKHCWLSWMLSLVAYSIQSCSGVIFSTHLNCHCSMLWKSWASNIIRWSQWESNSCLIKSEQCICGKQSLPEIPLEFLFESNAIMWIMKSFVCSLKLQNFLSSIHFHLGYLLTVTASGFVTMNAEHMHDMC